MVAWRPMRRPGVAVSVAAALLLAALFAGDSVWTALAPLFVAGGWGAFALAGRAPQPRGGAALVGLLLATAAWAGLSVAWSIAPDRSWAELNRILVFAAFLVVGLLLGACGPSARRWAAAALAAALGAAVLWALAGKVIPALFPDGDRTARLRDPIGYWNALALAADMLLVLASWLAATARTRALRAGGTLLAYAAVVAVLLTVSRTGVAGAAAAVVIWVWIARERLLALALVLAAALPGAAVAGWAFTRPALVDDAQSRADRVAEGALFGLLLLVGAAVAVLAAELVRRREPDLLRRRIPPAFAAAALAATVALGALAIALGGSATSVEQGPGRLLDASANNRLAWWGEAVDVFAADPLTGAGAGTFELARKRYRDQADHAVEPHNVPLQFLAGTGLIGLGLLLAFLAAAALAVAQAVRRLDGAERGVAAALATLPAVWVLQSLVDYPWDFVEVTGPALFAVGVLAAGGGAQRRRGGPFAVAAVVAVALAAAATVVTPWLAERSVRQVDVELGRGDVAAAQDAAEQARSLDPLSLAPVFARARVEEARGDEAAALEAYREAVRLQPENPETWYELGLYEFQQGDRCSAYVHLNEAYTRDPSGRQWVPDGPLVQSLEWVNEPGNC